MSCRCCSSALSPDIEPSENFMCAVRKKNAVNFDKSKTKQNALCHIFLLEVTPKMERLDKFNVDPPRVLNI